MGRRSTSSTKSGKFINPTEQAQKEAQKRELKKNKKQRMMFNSVQQPQLNERMLKDKGKKLCETFECILRLYEKENPDIYEELRNGIRTEEVESIPLPDMPHAPSNILIQDIPLPGAQPPSILKKTSAYGPPTQAVYILPLLGHGVPRLPPGRKPPGPHPGPPPSQVLQMYGRKVGFALDLPPRRRDKDMLYSSELAQRGHDDDVSSTSEDDGYPEDMDQDKHDSTDDRDTDRSDGESEGDEFVHRLSVRFADMPGKSRKKKKNMKELTPLQAIMLQMAVEEFSEDDDEDDSDDSEAEEQSQKQLKEESLSDGISTASSQQQAPPQSVPPSQIQAPPMPGPLPLGPPPAPPLRPRPPGMPGLQRPLPRLLPPGPPPGRPTGPPPGPPPGLPPGPPPQELPPRLPPVAPPAQPRGFKCSTQLDSGPKADDTSTATIEKKITATISAKPQNTNPKAGLTGFMPTALRVCWENKGAAAAPQRKSEDDSAVPLAKAAPKSGLSVQTKDDVYEAFIKEMEGLL
ncbi:unnamed protein product [Nyctereutes procyonoides]|uniref:(raccoon dog) hypothetical protein n=1 Tax=Nyctereutes procyonoides TaxID=34880 RepID=A0A811ZJF8_NYCPR|nr:unnamed protein product [Nyctereutes procyonoides]